MSWFRLPRIFRMGDFFGPLTVVVALSGETGNPTATTIFIVILPERGLNLLHPTIF